jgi:hypothetical protein
MFDSILMNNRKREKPIRQETTLEGRPHQKSICLTRAIQGYRDKSFDEQEDARHVMEEPSTSNKKERKRENDMKLIVIIK